MNKPESATWFLRSGLKLFSEEFPENYTAISGLLKHIPGLYEIEGERFTVKAINGQIRVRKAGNASEALIRANVDHKAIIAVVDGTMSVRQALAREQLVLFADTDALMKLGEVVKIVAGAAIRSSRLQNHFEAYREWVLAM